VVGQAGPGLRAPRTWGPCGSSSSWTSSAPTPTIPRWPAPATRCWVVPDRLRRVRLLGGRPGTAATAVGGDPLSQRYPGAGLDRRGLPGRPPGPGRHRVGGSGHHRRRRGPLVCLGHQRPRLRACRPPAVRWGALKELGALVQVPVGRRWALVGQAVDQGVAFLVSKDPAVADSPMGWGDTRPSASWFKPGSPSGHVADVLQTLEVLAELAQGRDPATPSPGWSLARTARVAGATARPPTTRPGSTSNARASPPSRSPCAPAPSYAPPTDDTEAAARYRAAVGSIRPWCSTIASELGNNRLTWPSASQRTR
jgi:hypothetical protein